MTSVIFRTAARIILPLMLLVSVILLLRGHNDPGGGFVGGLLAAAGFALYSLAIGASEARRVLAIDPRVLIGAGLVVALASTLPSIWAGEPFFSGLWASLSVPGFDEPIKVGTPLIFDIGVYLVVVGATVLMTLTLEDANTERDPGAPILRGPASNGRSPR